MYLCTVSLIAEKGTFKLNVLLLLLLYLVHGEGKCEELPKSMLHPGEEGSSSVHFSGSKDSSIVALLFSFLLFPHVF